MNDTPLSEQERTDGRARLDGLWEAGRLSPAEHERRTTLMSRARTRADLDAALADLPSAGGVTGPVLDGYPAHSVPVPSGSDRTSPVPDDGRTSGLVKLPRNTAGAIVALTPLVALALLLMTHHWWFFLAIPIVTIVLYGPSGTDGGDRGDRRERRQRDQRR